jgi:hypothetical protein
VRKPEEKRSLGRPRREWESNIKMDFREKAWGDVDWIRLAQTILNTILNLRVPQNVGKFVEN